MALPLMYPVNRPLLAALRLRLSSPAALANA